MERETLLNNLIGQSKIDRIKTSIQPWEGGVIKSSLDTRMDAWINQRFGQFGAKIVGTSDGAEKLKSKDITVMGGWCAIRTKDLMQLQQGVIVDPLLGTQESYQGTGQVADWIRRAISIDQIVEAIGIYDGTNYTAISEEQLWGDRVKTAVKNQLGRQLNESENMQIADAMQSAEERRYGATKKYLIYTTGKDIDLMRVVDKNIYGDLVEVRDAMLATAGISLEDLIDKYPEEQTTRGYSIVWGMYTGPYLALLQSKGYVKTSKGLIVEPWGHAISETRSKKLINQRIFGRNKNAYLTKGGANQDIGFVAYADTMESNGKRVGVTRTINEVPNPENYELFIEHLRNDPTCASLSLDKNPVFMWGTNLLPFGKTKALLLEMVVTKERFKEAKGNATNSSGTREEASRRTQALKDEYGMAMLEQAQQVITELEKMFQFVFKI